MCAVDVNHSSIVTGSSNGQVTVYKNGHPDFGQRAVLPSFNKYDITDLSIVSDTIVVVAGDGKILSSYHCQKYNNLREGHYRCLLSCPLLRHLVDACDRSRLRTVANLLSGAS